MPTARARHHLLRVASLAAVCAAVGCQLNLNGIPTSLASGDAGDGSKGAVTDAQTPDASNHTSAALPDEPADAAPADANVTDAQAERPVVHAACSSALPDVLPPAPPIRTDARGRPAFDMWRDIGCNDAYSYVSCDDDATDGTRCVQCLATGTPLPTDVPQTCLPAEPSLDGVGLFVPVSFRDGQCRWEVPVELKARLCCAQSSADCRAWPFTTPSKHGEVCARHEDCEAGLVCKIRDEFDEDPTNESLDIAVCACPEESFPFREKVGCVSDR